MHFSSQHGAPAVENVVSVLFQTKKASSECADVLMYMCRCVDVLMTVLMCWWLCWCDDDIELMCLMCWCVDVLMTVLMCCCSDDIVLMCWWLRWCDVLMGWCVPESLSVSHSADQTYWTIFRRRNYKSGLPYQFKLRKWLIISWVIDLLIDQLIDRLTC
jgi:hypothetical protein